MAIEPEIERLLLKEYGARFLTGVDTSTAEFAKQTHSMPVSQTGSKRLRRRAAIGAIGDRP